MYEMCNSQVHAFGFTLISIYASNNTVVFSLLFLFLFIYEININK